MAILPGKPLNFDEVISIVAANYPMYSYLLTPSVKGQPISALYPDVDFTYKSRGIVLAMLSPPNMTLRPLTIFGPDGIYDFDFPFNPPVGVASAIQAGQPFYGPDTFIDFISADYSGGTAASDAANDINVQVDAYVAANPTKRVLGILVSDYASPGGHHIATAKLVLRTAPG